MAKTEPASKDARAYVSGRFELHLDGDNCGVLSAIDGGHFRSEAIGEQVGGEGLVTRYPGRAKFDDVSITAGSTMSPRFWKWIKGSIDNKPERRNGAIITRDFENRERSRRTFYDALISEIQFPQLDMKVNAPQNITVKFSPERIEYSDKIGPAVKADDGKSEVAQKAQAPRNFQFAVDGFDKSVNQRATKVDAFTIKQNVINNPVGGLLYPLKAAGRIEFPTLSIYTAETYAGSWIAWWKEFVSDGNHVGSKERSGSITCTDATLQKELLRLDLRGVGITAITFDKLEAQSEHIRQAKIDLYVESMSLKT